MITAIRTGLDRVEVAERHEPIVEALRRQDADAAGQEVRRHVEEFGRLFVESRGERPRSPRSGRPSTPSRR